MPKTTGFFAYASHPSVLGETINAALLDLHRYQSTVEVTPWPQLDIPGRFVAEAVLSAIAGSDFVVADITTLNFNVTFEIGYAIGKRKRVLLVSCEPYAKVASEKINELGIFDTLGYSKYENSKALAAQIRSFSDNLAPIAFDATYNKKAPVYLTEDRWRTDGATRLISRIKKARLFFRSFDPREQSRLSSIEAIEQVAQSAGVLTHLVAGQVDGSEISNLRAAFVAGLAMGMEKIVAMLQQGSEPVPLDYRDLVQIYNHPEQIDDHISDFAGRVYECLSASSDKPRQALGTPLSRFELGASSAENELRDLHHYYLPTEGFRRAQRGEVRLVVGRKGSGKTAVFLQVRDRVRASRKNVVLDLKPDGFRLLKFKDRVLQMLERGSFEHTITAFWEYLLLLEICHKVVESDRDAHRFDDTNIAKYRRLSALYNSHGYEAQGDFSERMSRLLSRIENDYATQYGPNVRTLTSAQITTLIYGTQLHELENALIDYLAAKESVWVLFDNIDKGWSSRGIAGEDLVIVKSLVEATRKIERTLQRRDVNAHTLMFIRNDVHEMLIEQMSDRGKEPKALLDWVEPDLLRELVLRRAKFHSGLEFDSFGAMWSEVCVSHVDGEESSQYLIDRCLMRPRYLIDLINHCRGVALTLGHARIEQDDIAKGLRVFSADLIADLNHEIRDVFDRADDVLYAFIGCDAELSDDEVKLALMERRVPDVDLQRIVDLLLWYGFIGCIGDDGESRYIHDANYNPKLLVAQIKHRSPQAKSYRINPAFWPALGTVVRH